MTASTPAEGARPTGKVWILFGSTGEYSDHTEWTVCAYENEADADADCAALNKLAEGIEDIEWSKRDAAVKERLQPHDAFAQVDYAGVSYCVGACDVFASRRIGESA